MQTTLPSFLAAALVLAAFAHPAVAGGPPTDTSFLKRYAETRGFMLGRPTKPKFTPDGKAVLFLRAAGPTTPRQTLFEFDVATGKTKELLIPEMLLKGADENVSPEEKARRERQRVGVGGFADYHLDPAGGRVLVMLSGRPWVFDRITGKVRELNAGKGTVVDPKWSPDGKYVSYVRDYDVMAYDLASDKELSVTTGGTAATTHGLAEFVAQEEMDRHTGYWWSPDSKRIAYEEADHAGVEVWHVADPFKPGVAPQRQFYPRPGKKNVGVRLGIVPVTGGETKWVEWDRNRFEYMAVVRWDKVGPLTLQLEDRAQQRILLHRIEPTTGEAIALHHEPFRHSSTVHVGVDREAQVGWADIDQSIPKWVQGGNSFLWVAGGWGAETVLERRDTGGRLRWVSEGEPGGINLIAVREPEVAYTIRPDPTTMAVIVGKVPEGKDKLTRTVLTPTEGVHSAVVSDDFSVWVSTSTTLEKLPEATVIQRGSGQKLGTLPSVAEEPPFKPNVSIQKVGGHRLDPLFQRDGGYWTAVVRPRDFDPKKKYPVIVDVYGGPHHLHVVQAMRNWLVPQWLADQGFVVVAIDGRGTPGRGRDWERAIYQKLGTVPLEDQVKGLAALCDKFPELDRERVGIVGWSFGGYVAANAVLRRPDVFKAAVAGAPVTDWEDYDTHYTERYLGLLPEGRKAYDEASLLPLAKGLSRPLLLVHGTADDNVYYRHSLKLADALFRAGREFEMLPLPGVTHMNAADPQVAERLWERTVTFFRRHLGEAK